MSNYTHAVKQNLSINTSKYKIDNLINVDSVTWTGVRNQQAEMINSTSKSNDVIYDRADTVKYDSD